MHLLRSDRTRRPPFALPLVGLLAVVPLWLGVWAPPPPAEAGYVGDNVSVKALSSPWRYGSAGRLGVSVLAGLYLKFSK